MEIVFKKDLGFQGLWVRFINENKNVSAIYLPKEQEGQRISSALPLRNDLSFILVDKQNLPLAICPIYLFENSGNSQFKWADYNGYMPAPLVIEKTNTKHRERIEKECFRIIDELATNNNIKKTMLMVDPLSVDYSYNVLMKYGYLDSSINTYIIDLNIDIETLWKQLRKSYKSLINNGKEKYKIEIIDYTNPDFEIHNLYKELHHKAAGRITRPQETWDIQFQKIEDDNAILIGLKDEDQFVAFSYFYHHNNTACYASSSDDPDYTADIPLEHTIIWSAIEYYKSRGFNCIDMGWQQFSHQLFDDPSPKDLSISFFKRGFSGRIITLYRGVKYYDNNLMKAELLENLKEIMPKDIND